MRNSTETIEVKANQSARTFTIRKIYSDGSKVKYRTWPVSREEFKCEEMFTEIDWKNFLRAGSNYYIV